MFGIAGEHFGAERCWEMGRIPFRECCFGRENSLSSAANSVSSAENLACLLGSTNNRLRATH